MSKSDLSEQEIKYRRKLLEKLRDKIDNPPTSNQTKHQRPISPGTMAAWRSHGWFEGVPSSKEEEEEYNQASKIVN